eukprot:5224821-Pleurochrysis_carterae.AAC.1
MCGGQVVLCTPRDARKSTNSFDKNSPALSLCRQGGKGCHKATHACRGFTFVLEEVDGLKTSVVVDEHEQIL